ncbi:hypothetical protein Ddye_032210 [Dipteronia dyeriana]|uniref:Reverse transcriptase domain-containing protein n=1 Tax=Dipteronia dyeriana TaxID=168575 RepID=A0AAD9TKT3_9ROSI|nr:hypothetical protein Ddye_032210 [Dipteronia dyeriana]
MRDLRTAIKFLETKVEGFLDCDEFYWKQRSRVNWLETGDRNTKFFHSRARTRKRKKNCVERLIDSTSRVVDSEEGMAQVIKSFFSDLFISSNPSVNDISKATNNIRSVVSEENLGVLTAIFRMDEVRTAVFDLSPTKAPGPDRFHAIFFQKFWDVIGKDFSDVCLQILNGAASISEFNYTNVVLIPKTYKQISLKDFRPISLGSVVYKTVAKVLASRIKILHQGLISLNQSAFVPGRQIFDNVLVAFESLLSIARKRIRKKGLMTLKLDMSKTYDRVEWNFIRVILVKLNFPTNWVDLVMDCVSSTNLSFVMNGRNVGSVVPSRGLRQDAEKNGRGLGLKCCRSSPIISHMFFVDDTILFCKASEENSLSIKKILDIYEKGSGVQINLHKSSITFSPNVDVNSKSGIQQLLGVEDAWAIWENMNAFLNDGQSKQAEFVVAGADAFLAEFQNSRLAFSSTGSPTLFRSPMDWIAPPPSKIKLNSAAGFCVSSSSFGIRVVTRDDKGKVLLTSGSQMPGKVNNEVGELLALRKGLKLANYYNFGVDSITIASFLVAYVLNDLSVPLGLSKLFVLDIKDLMVDAGICKVQAISRSGNSLAQKLAYLAFSVQELLWLDFSPSVS